MKSSDIFIISENSLPLAAENLPVEWVKTPVQCPEVAQTLASNQLPLLKPLKIKAIKGFIFSGKEWVNNYALNFRTKSSNYKYQCVLTVNTSFYFAMKLNGCKIVNSEIPALDNYIISYFIPCFGQVTANKAYIAYPIIQYVKEFPAPWEPPVNAKTLNAPYLMGFDLNEIDWVDDFISQETFFNSLYPQATDWQGFYSEMPFYEYPDLLNETFAKDYLFRGIYGKETGDFNIYIYMDGDLFDICRYCNSLSITKQENSNELAKIELLKNCGVFDFYEFYNKKIEIFADCEKIGVVLLFSGYCNYIETNPISRTISLNCINTVDDKIELLSDEELSNIGYFSNKLFENVNKKEQFNKRMESVSASFYLQQDKIFITEWKPKSIADVELNCNEIYIDDTNVSGLKSGEVVNKINLNFDLIYSRKNKRNLSVIYNNNATACNMIAAACTLSPKVEDLKSALNGAGWSLTYFSFSPLPPSGGYDCRNQGGLEFSRWQNYDTSYSQDENGNLIMTRTRDEMYDYATYATASVAKWWVQEIGENLQITVKNQNSIDFFKEKSEDLSFSTVFRLPESDTFNENGKFDENLSTQTAQNSDIYQDCFTDENLSEYQDAMRYALAVAQTKINQSHVSEFSTKCKFYPLFDLSQTVKIDMENFKGHIKLKSLNFEINFSNKTAFCNISGHFYKGFSSSKTAPELPERQTPEYIETPVSHIAFGNVYLGYSQDAPQGVNACYFRERGDNIVGGTIKRYQHAGLSVSLPDIQKDNTDALNDKQSFEQDIAIPNTTVLLAVKC